MTPSGPNAMTDSPGVVSRPNTYLIAKNDAISPAGAGPLEFDWIIEQLKADPAVEARVLEPRNLALQQLGSSVVASVVVASMPESTAKELEKHPQVVIEPDYPLIPQPAPAPSLEDAAADPLLLSPFGIETEWRIQLRSPEGAPVEGATVYLYGSGVPAQGRSDAQGQVALRLLNESDATIRALYVNPQREFWSLWVDRPRLISGTLNTVVLQSLAQSFANFPQRQLLGWGQLAMRLDQVPRHLDGRGVRVAVVDSGAAALTHPDLAHVRSGVDLTGTTSNTVNWTDDTIAHGSHCTGVIAGRDDAGGIRGFAPAAEVFEARIFPGGRVSSLLDALDICINENIDVVNMSLGTGGSSQILLQKIAQAKEQGVACIVAAGNSGDGVQFPGVSPDVLTVAAIGQEGTFPESSYHAQQRWAQGRPDNGYFAAKFSCHGPRVGVCGPGVAVVSSVPPDGYASWDGTSMATPHVAGLAALALAHHPDFQQPALQLHTSARVDRLFEILRQSCTPLDLGDPERTGAGMPDSLRALGLDRPAADAGAGAAPGQPAPAAADAIRAALARVRQDLVVAGLLGAAAPDGRAATPALSDVARQLATLRAQMIAAGLLPARQSAPTG